MVAMEAKLMELLCTRLCHDITGPVGAIANGAEFLAEEGNEMRDQAVMLITQSAAEAVNRLQFYRMAYGRVGQKGEACLADVKELIRHFFEGGKISLDWPDCYTDAANVPLSRQMGRVIHNLVLLAAGALIRGGVISVRVQYNASGEAQVSVSASGITLKWDEKLGKALRHEVSVDDLEPATVQAYFTKLIADEAEVMLAVVQGSGMLELTATQRQAGIAEQEASSAYG